MVLSEIWAESPCRPVKSPQSQDPVSPYGKREIKEDPVGQDKTEVRFPAEAPETTTGGIDTAQEGQPDEADKSSKQQGKEESAGALEQTKNEQAAA